MERPIFTVSEFIALTNQTLEYAFSNVIIEGEVSEYRVSKGRWVYFKLQDANSSVQCFGTVYQIQFPVEDGMLVRLTGTPRLHNKYGFSVNIQNIVPSGEGNIKKALELLKKTLAAEGLFDESRKRPLPEMPQCIGLVTSSQAAAYQDFVKIVRQRWTGIEIVHVDVGVQGETAPKQIATALEVLNTQQTPIDVIVVTRGGGSAEDLMAFSSEIVVRAIAASRAPVIAGVGHEVDISLADLAADMRATTPTNAAQLVVPDKHELIQVIAAHEKNMQHIMYSRIATFGSNLSHAVAGLMGGVRRPKQRIEAYQKELIQAIQLDTRGAYASLEHYQRTLQAYNPKRMLMRGYSLVKDRSGTVITSAAQLKKGDGIMVELKKGKVDAEVTDVKKQ